MNMLEIFEKDEYGCMYNVKLSEVEKYNNYLKKVGYSKTFKEGGQPIYEIKAEDILYNRVFVSEGQIFLDFNEYRDLVYIGDIPDNILKLSEEDINEYVDRLLSEELSNID